MRIFPLHVTRKLLGSLIVLSTLVVASGNGQEPLQNSDGEQPLIIETNGEDHEPELSGQKLTVAGSGNTVKIVGTCPVLVVTGNKNTITIEAVDRITVSGNDNSIQWASAIKLDLPKITNEGTGNQISSGTGSGD